MSKVSGYVNYNIGMEPEVRKWRKNTKRLKKQEIWTVLLPPGEDVWRIGDQGVRLQHASTGKILTVTRCSSFSFSSHFSSNDYPESWGEGLHEVVAAKPNQKEEGTQWTVNFFQIPNMGETTMLMLGSMMIFQFVKLSLAAEYLREDYQEELYGGGTSNKTTSSSEVLKIKYQNCTISHSTQAWKHSASSVTDLRLLLSAETALLRSLEEQKESFEIATKILEAEGFTTAAILNSDVRHPIDAYNLIKRLGRIWPKVGNPSRLLMGFLLNLSQVRDALEFNLEGDLGRKLMQRLGNALERFPSWEENRVTLTTKESV